MTAVVRDLRAADNLTLQTRLHAPAERRRHDPDRAGRFVTLVDEAVHR
ncbi:hypothetical protein [Streptomyces sp. RKAG337]|nr:hypothetical protein [Streptomyces sp. RKAG337]MCM2431045.1 hypothetical protein [Streptomyces sp. RKAG337]